MESSPNITELRSSLDELNIGISEVQTFGSSNEIIIRIKGSYKSEDILSILKDVFSQEFPNENIEFRRFETVGPKIGSELQGKSLLYIFFAIIGILLFIALISYSPSDPNFIFTENTKIQNILGFQGSYISDLFYQSIGLISYLISITYLITGINIFRKKEIFILIESSFYICLLYTSPSPRDS